MVGPVCSAVMDGGRIKPLWFWAWQDIGTKQVYTPTTQSFIGLAVAVPRLDRAWERSRSGGSWIIYMTLWVIGPGPGHTDRDDRQGREGLASWHTAVLSCSCLCTLMIRSWNKTASLYLVWCLCWCSSLAVKDKATCSDGGWSGDELFGQSWLANKYGVGGAVMFWLMVLLVWVIILRWFNTLFGLALALQVSPHLFCL